MVKQKKRLSLLQGITLVAALSVILAAGAVYGFRRAQRLKLRQSALQQTAGYSLTLADTALLPTGGSVTVQDALGEEALTPNSEPQTLTVHHFADTALQLPEALSADAEVAVSDAQGETVFTGSVDRFHLDFLPQNGSYCVSVSVPLAQSAENGSYKAALQGTLEYAFTLVYDVQPYFALSAETLMQGDAVVLRAYDVAQGMSLWADTGGVMDFMRFSPVGGGVWQALLGVSYRCAPGSYVCEAKAGDGETVQLAYTVTEQTYTEQQLTISTATKSATVDNSAAQQQYNDMIAATMYHWTPQIYFTGPFLHPLPGSRVTTEFGLFRYTNGSKTASRHVGVDLAAAKGTDIQAPAAGEVLVAEYLTTTGWTVCMEHGMGVHSYYYHMDSVAVEAGDFLQAGDVIGAVGETGYATGPHLHYNIMVGENSVDPFATMDGSSGFFALLES